MPSYSSHLLFNFIILSALFILYQSAGAPLTTIQLALFLIFYVLGTAILTPDLDSKSEAARRCGAACTPYRKLFRHRGLSHHPLWGIASRIVYVTILASITLWLVWMFVWRFEVNSNSLLTFLILHIKEIGTAGAGLFLSNLLHIFLDKIA